MPGENLGQYPRGQVTWNGVALYQNTDFSYSHVNGAKLKSTLRKDPGGFVRGARAVSGSMNLIISEDGEEFDWTTAVTYMIPQQALVKLPGGQTKLINCVITEEGAEISLEDGVKKPIKFVGYFVDIGF